VPDTKQVTPIASVPLHHRVSESSHNPHSIQKNEQSLPSNDDPISQVGAYEQPDISRQVSYNPTFLPNLDDGYSSV